MKNNQLHANHRNRMREKFLKFGLNNFADHEVLELLLYFAIPRKDVNPLSHELINHFGSVQAILNSDVATLKQVKGIGEHAAVLLNLFGAVKNRYFSGKEPEIVIDSSDMAKLFCKNLYENFKLEKFFVVGLNSSNKVIGKRLINTGTETSVNVVVKDITRFLLENNCAKIIISHCHTGQSIKASDSDLTITKAIVSTCFLNDVDLLDHIIVGPTGEHSFAENDNIMAVKQDAYNSLPMTDKSSSAKKFRSEGYFVNKQED